MTSHTIAAPSAGTPEQRYRRAEKSLWELYGLRPAERLIDVRGVPLRVLEVGSGEPVLFVHGTGGPGTWPSLVGGLSGCRCMLLDRPGWGLSAPVDYSRHPYSAFVADLLCDVLDTLEIERAHVVGASIGDNWALRLAERHPDRVGRVVMLGGGPLVDDVTPPAFIRLLASPLGRVVAALPQRPRMVRAQLRAIGHRASLDAGRIPDEFFDWREALTRHTRSMRSERDMVRAIVRGRSFRPGLTFGAAELAAIRRPALLVYGTADPLGTVETWRRFAAALPRGELQLVDGAGHVPWFDEPGRVAAEIDRFLAGDRGRRASEVA